MICADSNDLFELGQHKYGVKTGTAAHVSFHIINHSELSEGFRE